MNTLDFAFFFFSVTTLVGWKLSWLKLTFTPLDVSSYKFLKWKHQRFIFYSVNKMHNFSLLGKHVMYRLNKCYRKSLWWEVLQAKIYETEMTLLGMTSVKKISKMRRKSNSLFLSKYIRLHNLVSTKT